MVRIIKDWILWLRWKRSKPKARPYYCCYLDENNESCKNKPYYTVVDWSISAYDCRNTHTCKEHVGEFWNEHCTLEPLDWFPRIYNYSLEIKND